METHTEELSTAEAAKVLKALSAAGGGVSLSTAKLARLLEVPEDKVVEKLNETRGPRRHFVDRSGLVSAAIALALVVGFLAAGQITNVMQPASTVIVGPRMMMPRATTQVIETQVASAPAQFSDDGVGAETAEPTPTLRG